MYLIQTGRLVFPAQKNKEGKTLTIRRFNSAQVESSWKEPVQRAELVLARNVADFENQKVKEVFKVGDPVEVWLGYNDRDTLEFSGYITEVGADVQLILRCQDEMWKVRRIPVNYSAKSATLESLLRAIVPGYEIDALEGVELGTVRFSKTTVGAALEKLAADWKLHSYMKGKTLVCGKYYSDDTGVKPATIDVDRFAIDNTLKYKTSAEVILKIRSTSILKNGKKIEAEIGEEGGDSLELNYYNVEVKAELEKRIKTVYDRAKAGGFDGSFTTFGFPRLAHGMRAELKSAQYEDRNGTYYVDGVVKTFGPDGYRQDVKLGGQATLRQAQGDKNGKGS